MGLFFDVDHPLVDLDSDHQHITLFENRELGKVLLLDGLVMTTERDAPYYHEPLVHPALTAHPDPRRVLVLGGGDGGTVSELVRYPGLERIDVVEIDPEVVAVCRRHLPRLSRGFDDPRVVVEHADGAAWIGAGAERFDVILVDGSDPIGPAEALFASEFLAGCARRLGPNGIFVIQSEGPLHFFETITSLHRDLPRSFAWTGIYTTTVPTYPGGLWTISWAGHGRRPLVPHRPAPAGLTVYHEGMFPDPDRVPAMLRHLNP